MGSIRVTAATQPSDSTAHPSELLRLVRVAWVFPSNKVLSLERNCTVGRGTECDVVLPGNEISRRHAEFRVVGPLVAIFDLESRNGVYVNGVRCNSSPLKEGDVVRCGEWIGILEPERDSLGFREIIPGWFGGSRLYAAVEPVSRVRSDLPVIVQGETGTGKEGVAQAVHRWSGRTGAFVPVNCAALQGDSFSQRIFFGVWELVDIPLEELRVGTRVNFSLAFNYLGPVAIGINRES